MTSAQAEAIIDAAESAGIFDLDCYYNYSGRGMFGETTTGVMGRIDDINKAVALASADRGRQFVKGLGTLKFDTIGLEYVAY